MFEIRTRSGRIAGPFTREKLKQYASDKRLDPRCEIRKHDPDSLQPWRPCWKTKGLFPPEVVEACARSPSAPAPHPAREEPEPVRDNWAFAVENRAQDEHAPETPDDLWAGVPSGPVPPPAKPSRKSRRKEKRPARSGRIAWEGIGSWVVLIAVGLQIVLAILIGMGKGNASPEELAELPGVMGLLIGGVIGVPIAALLSGLLFRLGFLIVRVPNPGYGELCGSGFYLGMIGLLFSVSATLALRASESSLTSSAALMLTLGRLGFGVVSSVGVLMMRHALDPLRALVVYIVPVVVIIGLLVSVLLALGIGLGALL